jgi:hypothetical protein
MNGHEFSEEYVQHLAQGAFPGRIDPWAEEDGFFQQIHSGIIDSLITKLQPHLQRKGYRAGKEMSLQITQGREPDIFVQRATKAAPLPRTWNYELAAAEILAEPGEEMTSPTFHLQAIHIREHENGNLITVVEIVSPGNKIRPAQMDDYRLRRERLIVEHEVNVMEIDLTRSVKKLLMDDLTKEFSYHAAVFLPGSSPRVIGMPFEQPFRLLALPLRGEVLPMDIQAAYEHGYRTSATADHIHSGGGYTEDRLPFSSLLTDVQKQDCLQQVKLWQDKLTGLQK